MRLISCYIGGFGTFFNQSFDLSSNLVAIKQDNGWGKTTLVAFLRCMLFGMEAGRNKSVEENDRLHYEPWRGGAYGGTLTFSVKGKTYRIERSFGKTPAYDTVRLYDQNNLQCYDFGEKAENLGEILFGMNAESYRKSVYIPQGEIYTQSFSDDIKSRLLSLLSTGGTGAPIAENALEKLNDADKALRAKRKPSKGKLDEIEEELSQILQKKNECEENRAKTIRLREQIEGVEKDLREFSDRMKKIDEELACIARQKELESARRNAQDIKLRIQETEEELSSLREFFADADPKNLNIEGLQSAVDEFYQMKARLSEVEKRISDMQESVWKKSNLKTQMEECENALDSFDKVLLRSKGKGWRRKGKKIPGKMNKTLLSVFFVSILVAVVGAFMAVLEPPYSYIGLAFAGAGGISITVCFILMLPRREKTHQGVKVAEGMEAEVSAQYDETYARWRELKDALAEFPEDLETEYKTLTAEREELINVLSGKENAIRGFLQNFRFEQGYDFRSALIVLTDKRKNFLQYESRVQEYAEKLKEIPAEVEKSAEERGYAPADAETLQAKKENLEKTKEGLLSARARLYAEVETLECKANPSELDGREKELWEEKKRLEKRHTAILQARVFLTRAKEEMASRYLDGVEKGCLQYLKALGGKEGLRFAPDGSSFWEDRGKFREIDYYSVGAKELVGFCTRIALADALFQGEKPVLILDDPFVNLDDEKTEKAKRLTKELSKKYQILYLTCKQERKL